MNQDITSYAYAMGLLQSEEKNAFREAMDIKSMFTASLSDIEALVVPKLFYDAIDEVYADWLGEPLTGDVRLSLYSKNKQIYPLFARALWDHPVGYVTEANKSLVVTSPFTDWVTNQFIGVTGPVNEVRAVFSVFLLKVQNAYNAKLGQYNVQNNTSIPYLAVYLLTQHGSTYSPGRSYDIIWSNDGVLIDIPKLEEYGRFIIPEELSVEVYEMYKAIAQG